MNQDIDWRARVFETGWLQKLDKLAARRFGAGGLAEEASTYVINRISENNWMVLRKFQGQSKPETFLYTVAGNFLEEFSRERFGRPRPPEWVKREGPVWVSIWRAVCLERQEIETIVDRFSADGSMTPRQVRAAAKSIKARALSQVQGLREFSTSRALSEEGGSMEDNLVDNVTPEDLLARADYDALLALVSHLFEDLPAVGATPSLRAMAEGFALSVEESKALRLVFQEGHKRNAVARKMGVATHVPGRMINKSLAHLRAVIEARGLGADNLIERTA